MLKHMTTALILITALASIAEAIEETDGMSEEIREAPTAHQAYDAMPNDMSTGPYPATMTTLPSLPNHVIYQPKNLASIRDKGLAILLWGNGGCTDDGASARLHLTEIASHGYLVIAPGNILSGPSAPAGTKMTMANFMTTTVQDVLEGLDWALQENLRPDSDFYGKINPDNIAISGHSCGGILSIKIAATDERIKAIVVHNSGVFPNKPERPMLITDKAWLQHLSTPILYVVGNSSDAGQPVALDDFKRIDQVPVFLASLLTVGHQGTFAEASGGKAARVALNWLEWQLRGNMKAASTFIGESCGLCADSKWKVLRKGF